MYRRELHKRNSPLIRSQGNNLVLDTKAIIETHVAESTIRIIPGGQLKRLQHIPLHNVNNVTLYLTSVNYQKAGLSNNHKIPFYLMV